MAIGVPEGRATAPALRRPAPRHGQLRGRQPSSCREARLFRTFSAEQIWKTTYLKTKFSSAAVIGDHAYGLDEGRLACIGLADGKRVWKKDKFGFGQHLLFGEWLLVQTEPGDVVIGKLGPEGFAESGRIPALSSMTWNTPALAGRVLLVRNDVEASAWLLPEPAGGATGR